MHVVLQAWAILGRRCCAHSCRHIPGWEERLGEAWLAGTLRRLLPVILLSSHWPSVEQAEGCAPPGLPDGHGGVL